jgi:GH15 family glucan-1,4-alpha-glucosidase
VARARAAFAIGLAILAATVLLSGGSGSDPRASWALPGLPGPLRGKEATQADRRWIARARPLGEAAPEWARRFYLRSLFVLRALTDRRSGAVAAGFRNGWVYVWPRDAGAVAIALASAGYRAEARRIVDFLVGLDLSAAARFHSDGAPVDGREAQGDAAAWITAAARAAGLEAPRTRYAWRDRADYQEKEAGDYLANAIVAGARSAQIRQRFGSRGVLVRRANDPDSGIDSAVAWAVRPFPRSALFPAVRRSLHRLLDKREERFGIVPSEDWNGGEDPWTAPTAWTAWALAALGDRSAALRLLGALRRAATPTGLLPERVDAQTGIPTSTTPLAWSHAFAILAIRELWPGRSGT